MATTEVIAPQDIEIKQTPEHVSDPCAVVIFGASGDLTKRKLLPALFHLQQSGLLPKDFAVVGVARRDLGPAFAEDMKEGIIQSDSVKDDSKKKEVDEFISKVSYHAMNFDDHDGYEKLKDSLVKIDQQYGTKGNRLFYLATAPEYFAEIIRQLSIHEMSKAKDESGWVRTIIEKPFGHDLQSARELSNEINKYFSEDQIFRIDHYLGKETVQNILVFRFANGIFEPIWNRNFVDHVQITAAEEIGIEGRGPFYEKAGTLRDVVQNHVMELMSFVAMEPPVSFEADAMRREKIKVWRAVKPVPLEDTVRGQYGPGKVGGKDVIGYRQEDRVNPQSVTETYVALKLEIENWRWAGVPFYVRAGKRLKKRETEITVQFKRAPLRLFRQSAESECDELQPNIISMRIQPDEGISLRFATKVPGLQMKMAPVMMDFSYAQAFGVSSANGYERLLLDAMLGDATLFAHRDGVEATWSIMTPILEKWAKTPPTDFPNYSAGTWGPKAADELMRRDCREWRNS
jgi:glucose-6-phosphate 1-dehydrogenase